MTREEAIKILDIMQLKYVNDDGTPKFDTDEFEALKMAIEALRQVGAIEGLIREYKKMRLNTKNDN